MKAYMMLSKRFFFLLALGLLLFSPPVRAADVPIVPGEKLTFLLRWEFVPAGEASLTVGPVTEIDGQPAFHFTMTTKTNKFLDMFYKVRDRVDSYTDLAMTRSLYFKKKQREGKTRRNVTVTFDWDNNLAVYTNNNKKRDPLELLPGAFDPLGIFYFVRSAKLEKGLTLERPVSDGKKCVIGIGHIVKRETITVPAGTFDTFLIQPDLKDVGGVFEKSDDANIHIWVTADERHIPVKIQSRVVVGRFMGELTELHLPAPE
jgi:hypothetical protein